MAATPNSTTTAYATGADVVACRDWRAVADLLNDDNTRPASSAAVVGAFAADTSLGQRALRWASAQIEAAVTCGNRYQPADLVALAQSGTVCKDLLVGLTCDLAFWWLTKRRKPGAKPWDIAGVQEALDQLDRLRTGERIFPFADAQEAGLPEVTELDEVTDLDTAATPISYTASRLFGQRNR